MLSKKYKTPLKTFPRSPKTSTRGQFLTIKAHPNSIGYPRFNSIISLKYDKRSVYRHKLKRAIFQEIKSLPKPIIKGYDFLIIINPNIFSQSTSLDFILKELRTLLLKF